MGLGIYTTLGTALDLWRGSLLPLAAWQTSWMLDQTGYISVI